jgi:hypothetical protein
MAYETLRNIDYYWAQVSYKGIDDKQQAWSVYVSARILYTYCIIQDMHLFVLTTNQSMDTYEPL